MRICIPTETKDGKTAKVYGHFGSAPYFTVYDTDKDTVEVIDNAITRTMSRTVITHLMTQTMVCSMLFFGGETLHNFSLALTIGILFGIYSSVLVACPVAMWLGVSQRNLSQDQPKENQSQEINP